MLVIGVGTPKQYGHIFPKQTKISTKNVTIEQLEDHLKHNNNCLTIGACKENSYSHGINMVGNINVRRSAVNHKGKSSHTKTELLDIGKISVLAKQIIFIDLCIYILWYFIIIFA